jgi:bifunctional non-homologous end joining protein LigD
VRMRRRPGEKRSNWLLIKQRDADTRTTHDRDILRELPLSVKTGRSLAEIAQHKRRLKRKAKAKRKTTKWKKRNRSRAKRQ